MQEQSPPTYAQNVERVVALLQGKWTVQILCAMRLKPVRLSEIKREIPPASKKALVASLRSLEAAGVVLRRDLSKSILHVEYEIIEAMRDPLISLLDRFAEWGELYASIERSIATKVTDGQMRQNFDVFRSRVNPPCR